MGAFATPRLRSSLPAVDLNGFFRAVGEALTLELDRAKLPHENRPLYTQDYPKERLADPTKPFEFIGYHTVRTRRASTSNKAYRAAKNLTVYEDKASEKNEGYRALTLGWPEEAIVQFTILAPSNARADALMTWFMTVVQVYHSVLEFFKARGVEYLVFAQRLEDTIEKVENQDLYTRRLQFCVRVQNLITFEAKTLESLNVTVTTRDDVGEISSFSLPAAP